jgi:hypothetical protein
MIISLIGIFQATFNNIWSALEAVEYETQGICRNGALGKSWNYLVRETLEKHEILSDRFWFKEHPVRQVLDAIRYLGAF